MKYYFSILLFTAIALISCGEGSDDPDEKNKSNINITLRSQTIEEGAEIDAGTSVLTLNYNTTVKVTGSGITINGTNVTAKSNEKTSMSVDIPLTLEAGMSYVVKVSKGAIVSSIDAAVSVPELTINFRTKAKPQSVISATPVAATTDTAQKLYAYFLEQYGKKTISSVMANVNWNNNCAEKVFKLTGKYPAMNCYDFIHICIPKNNWINYNDITPVTDWVQAGGIVQLMWHFNVPVSEDKVNAITASGSDTDGNKVLTCTPGETTFRATNVFTEGSGENKWFYQEMDKVIAVILKLQEAGIAATWRPFHEAAGNAIAKQQAGWTKAWFWWGYDGADTYKKLWTTMFDYFKQNGVHNLIWIWTSQNYNGNAAQYNQDTDWYPGEDYVDMVARDLYGYSAAQNYQEFTEIQDTYPHKMVVLGECGKGDAGDSGTIGDCWTAGAKWGHFMVWYQGGQGSTDTMCSDAWWKNAMTDSHVITRDQVKF